MNKDKTQIFIVNKDIKPIISINHNTMGLSITFGGRYSNDHRTTYHTQPFNMEAMNIIDKLSIDWVFIKQFNVDSSILALKEYITLNEFDVFMWNNDEGYEIMTQKISEVVLQ